MHRLTNSETVTSSLACAVLFSATMFTGYALAADVTPGPAPASTGTAASETGHDAMAKAEAKDELRIASLHDRLKLMPAQEPLWKKVVEVMRSNDRTIDALAKARHEHAATMTAVEDLHSYGEITEAHAAGVRAFAPAFGALYDSMSPAQRANADSVFRSDDHRPHGKTT